MSDVKEPAAISLDIALDSVMKDALSSVERREQAAKAPPADVELEVSSAAGGGGCAAPVGGRGPAAGGSARGCASARRCAAPVPAKRTPQDAIIEALIKGKQEMTEALQQTQKEAKDLLDARVRMQAEFENYKKRINRDKQDAAHALTQIDHAGHPAGGGQFERALVSVDESTLTPEMKNLVAGIRMVSKQMSEALKKVACCPSPAKANRLIPRGMRRFSQVPATGDMTPGTVVEEHQKGYLLGEQLLRPALVVVAGPRE